MNILYNMCIFNSSERRQCKKDGVGLNYSRKMYKNKMVPVLFYINEEGDILDIYPTYTFRYEDMVENLKNNKIR